MLGPSASKPAAADQQDRLRKALRVSLAALGVVLFARGIPLLLTRSPSDGRAGFIFAIVMTLGGVAALASAIAGPRSRLWPAALVPTGMAVAAVVLVVAWAVFVLIAHPDLGG